MKLLSIFIVICLSLKVSAQTNVRINPGASSYYDSIKTRSENCFVLHYHEVSNDRKKQMIFSDGKDIFNDSINKFSRIIISNGSQEIDLPTIPLENITILEDEKLIVGLTRIQVSPYLVVIYNFNGELLYKGNLGTYTLKLGKGRLKQLVGKYPSLLRCIERSNCFKEGDTCYMELSRGMLNIIGRDSARTTFKDELIYGHYLPFLFVSSQGGIYSRYKGSYRYSDPLHDLIMIGSVPYLLILNTEDGKHVNVPLISNCDLKQEFEGN